MSHRQTTEVTAAAVRLAPILGDPDANVHLAVEAIEQAARAGATLVVLPELSSSGYAFTDADEARSVAEPIPGPTTTAWSEAAARLGTVVVGGICELDDDGELRNSVVVIDADGRLLATYRKIHSWGIEKGIFKAGTDAAPVVHTAAGAIGIGICYDLWFPEHSRSLVLRGAQILAFPSNLSHTDAQPGLPHLDTIVAIATAHTNRVNLVLADRCRTERGKRFLGAALLVDAEGTLLAGPPQGDEQAIVTATFDLARADDKTWGDFNDVIADRRPEAYPQS